MIVVGANLLSLPNRRGLSELEVFQAAAQYLAHRNRRPKSRCPLLLHCFERLSL